MKKQLLRVFLIGFILFIGYNLYKFYDRYQEKLRHAAYVAGLIDTSSPTVTVLRDSILVGYRNEKKTIHVYVPPKYANDTTTRYPVIYMMDGESCFNDLENESPEWQIDEVINTAVANNKQAAIVIGINDAEDRNAEYTPWINDDNPDAHGDKYAQWVTNDLMAWVDANYRTKPGANTIGGISRSGMMAYYMIMAHPDAFDSAMIQSPSMWVDYDRLMAMELSESQLEGKKIFVSVGEYEGKGMIGPAKDVYEKFKAKGMDSDHLHYEMILKESHWHITWRKSFAVAYPWMMH